MCAFLSKSNASRNHTRDGVRRIVERLDEGLRAVARSDAAEPLKEDVRARISQLKINLRAALNVPEGDLGGWVAEMAPQFDLLETRLAEIGIGPHPTLTAAGLTRVMAQLDADQRAVQASGASDELKEDIRFRISQLKVNLRIALADLSADFNGWVLEMAPQFAQLSSRLAEALGGGVGPIGACAYEDGCITSTRAQCEEIGGSFFPGTPCP